MSGVYGNIKQTKLDHVRCATTHVGSGLDPEAERRTTTHRTNAMELLQAMVAMGDYTGQSFYFGSFEPIDASTDSSPILGRLQVEDSQPSSLAAEQGGTTTPVLRNNSEAIDMLRSTASDVNAHAEAWLRGLEVLIEPEDSIRVSQRYATYATSRFVYSRRSTRGRGIRLLGGAVAKVSSLDVLAFTIAMEPGFSFVRNKQLLYQKCMAESRMKGYWIQTPAGVINFPPTADNPSDMYASVLARRASEGLLFRDYVADVNRELAVDSWVQDWREVLSQRAGVIDIGPVDRLWLRWRRWLNRRGLAALPQPPRQ
nr:hypothetical protein [Tolivirales sp.]